MRHSPANQPAGRTAPMTGQPGLPAAFAEFAAQVAEFSGEMGSLAVPPHEVDTAEGYRLFLRYLTIGIDQFVEYADPAFPAFYHKSRDGVRKFAGDSPGQLYDSCTISYDYEYVVQGSMAETALIELSLYSGDLSGRNGQRRRLIAALTEEDIDVTEDGSFTITLDRNGGPGNALRLEKDVAGLSVRRYLRDPRTDRPRALQITRTSGEPALRPLAPEALADGVRRAGAFAGHNVRIWSQWADRIRKTKLNRLAGFDDPGDIYTPAGHAYLDGYWSVPEGHALSISFTPPPGTYWSFVPMTYWLESLEWRFGNRVFATSFDTEPSPDGVVRLALAHADPDLPGHTWLETLGRHEGLMAFRLARHTGPMPDVEVRLVHS